MLHQIPNRRRRIWHQGRGKVELGQGAACGAGNTGQDGFAPHRAWTITMASHGFWRTHFHWEGCTKNSLLPLLLESLKSLSSGAKSRPPWQIAVGVRWHLPQKESQAKVKWLTGFRKVLLETQPVQSQRSPSQYCLTIQSLCCLKAVMDWDSKPS